jgi:hypothetical protein
MEGNPSFARLLSDGYISIYTDDFLATGVYSINITVTDKVSKLKRFSEFKLTVGCVQSIQTQIAENVTYYVGNSL